MSDTTTMQPQDWRVKHAATLSKINTDFMLPDDNGSGSPVNHWKGRSGYKPIAIVYHITESSGISAVDQWFNNPTAQASAHFAIDRDGSIHQYVSTKDTAWSNGNLNKPNALWLPWIVDALNSLSLPQAQHINPNWRTISIEHVGFATSGITSQQVDATVALSSMLIDEWDMPVHYGADPKDARRILLRHSDFDTVTRANCPGVMFPLATIIKRLCGVA